MEEDNGKGCAKALCQEYVGDPEVDTPNNQMDCTAILSDGLEGYLEDPQIMALLQEMIKEKPQWSILNPVNFNLGDKDHLKCVKRFIDDHIQGRIKNVIVPFHSNYHWVLLVVQKEKIAFYNSFGYNMPENLEELCKMFLPKPIDHLKEKDGYPQQTDEFNCGVFLVKAVEILITKTPWDPETLTPRNCRHQFINTLSTTYKCLFNGKQITKKDLKSFLESGSVSVKSLPDEQRIKTRQNQKLHKSEHSNVKTPEEPTIRQSCGSHDCKELFLPLPEPFQCEKFLNVGRKGWLDEYDLNAALELVLKEEKDWSFIHHTNFDKNCIECIKRFIKARLENGDEAVVVPVSDPNHWALVVVSNENTIFYNSLPLKDAKPLPAAIGLAKALGVRYENLTKNKRFPKQDDNDNCGIFVIKAVETLVTGRQWIPIQHPPEKCRREIVEELMKTRKCMMGNRQLQTADLNRMYEEKPILTDQLLFGGRRRKSAQPSKLDNAKPSVSNVPKNAEVKAMRNRNQPSDSSLDTDGNAPKQKLSVELAPRQKMQWEECHLHGGEMRLKSNARKFLPFFVFVVKGADGKKMYRVNFVFTLQVDDVDISGAAVVHRLTVSKTDKTGKKTDVEDISGADLMRLDFKDLKLTTKKSDSEEQRKHEVILEMNSTYQPSVEIFEVVDGKEVLVHTECIKETKFRTVSNIKSGAIRELRLKCDPTAQASANRAAEKRKNAPLDCGAQLKKARIEETGSDLGAEDEDAPELERMEELKNKQQTSKRREKPRSNDTKVLQKQPKKALPEISKNKKKKKNCSK